MKKAKRMMHHVIADEQPQSVAEHLLLNTYHRIRRAEKDTRFGHELASWELLEIAVATVQAGGRLPVPGAMGERKIEKERNKIARLIARHFKHEYKHRTEGRKQ